MSTSMLNLPVGVWTEITNTPGTLQSLGNREYFFVESESQPVGLNIAYRRGLPGQEYTVDPKIGSIWGRPKSKIMGIDLIITEGRNPRDVYLQDQTTPPFDLYFAQAKGAPTTLTADTAIDGTQITIANTTNFAVGDYIGIFSVANNRFYFGEVLTINVNTLTLDTPLDFAFVTGENVQSTTRDLNVIGSRISPQIFSIRGPGIGSSIAIDITRILFSLVYDSAGGLNDFGNIEGGLTNGIVLRRNNGRVDNIANIKTNANLKNLAYDYSIFDATNPGQGVYGSATRYTFAGPDKHGVAVRLRAGESLDLIIQDNLSSLDKFRIIGAGHFVEC